MDVARVTENAVVTGSDDGRGIANLNYILYIVGFFCGITAIVAVGLAYANRETATEPFRSHLKWQIRIFWRGVWFWSAITVLYILSALVGVATLGFGFVFLAAPLAVGLWWAIWTIMAIMKGMRALGRREAIA